MLPPDETASEPPAISFDAIVAEAAANDALPQERAKGWPREDGWRLCRVTERVDTRSGVAFLPGDLTIGQVVRESYLPEEFVTAYSHRTFMNTPVPKAAIAWFEDQ